MSFYQFLIVLRARKKIALFVFLVTVFFGVLISLFLPKMYEASASLVVNYAGTDPVTGGQLPAQLIPGYMATQIDVVNSPKVALKVVENLQLYTNPVFVEAFYKATEGRGSIRDWLATILIKNLTVKPSRESSVFILAYESQNPDFAATLANAFAEAYIETNLELKIEPSRRAANWFETQVEEIRQNLINAQRQLSDYQREKEIVSVDERMDVESTRLAQLSQQLVIAQAELFHQKSRLDAVLKGGIKNIDSSVLADPIISDLKVLLARSEVGLAELAQRFSEQHPEYRAVKSEVLSLSRKLASEFQFAKSRIKSDVAIAQKKVTELASAANAQKQVLLEINDNRDLLDVYTRDVSDLQQILSLATQRLAQTFLEGESSESDISILSPAVAPIEPVRPNLIVNLILSVFLGLLLSIIVAVWAELLNKRVRSAEDVVLNVNLPVLGELLFSKPVLGQAPKLGFGQNKKNFRS